MKVLHAVEAFGGGLFEVVRLLAEGGAREGDEVAVAYGVRAETPPSPREVIEPAVKLVPLRSWDKRGPAQVGGAWELRRLVRSWQPDVVHLHSSFAAAAAVAGGIGRSGSPPTIYSPQAFPSTLTKRTGAARLIYRRVESLIASQVTLVVGSCQSEARYATDVLGAKAVRVIENGIVELDNPSPPTSKASPPVVLAAGRLVSQRQPEACAEILGRLRDIATVRWIGDGEGDRRESGLAALQQAGVELTGWVPRESWFDQLAGATVYLHWTASDGQPLSVLEAMAADTVVVASDIPSSRDLLSSEQLSGSESDAAGLIRRILENEGLAAKLREDQRNRRSSYAASRMVDDWLRLYRSVARAKR